MFSKLLTAKAHLFLELKREHTASLATVASPPVSGLGDVISGIPPPRAPKAIYN